ncbi:MAG: ABC transporter permease [Henriciella sp.]
MSDISAGFLAHQIWRNFAWEEILSRYHRSALGLLWIVFGYAFFVGGIAFFFGGFAKMGLGSFTIYVAIGYACFQFLVANVVDGCAVFTGSASWIRSTTLPYSIYVYKSIFRSLLPIALQLIVVAIAMLYWQPPLKWNIIFVIPAFAIFLINAVAIQYLCGLIAARYRDVTHLVGTITRILIFTTPILWVREERTGVIGLVADLNPLTHYIEIFRAPLMGDDIRTISWFVVAGFTVFVWLAAALAADRMQRRLAFWV